MNMSIRKKQVDIIKNLVLAAFFINAYLSSIFAADLNFYFSLALGLISHLLCLLLDFNKSMLKQYLIIMFFLIFGFLSFIYNNNSTLGELVSSYIYFGVAVLILNTNLDKKLWKFLFFIVSFIFLLFILSGNSFDSIFVNASRNYVSVYLLFFIFMYYVSNYKENTINILPSVLFFLLSVFAIGRTGILVSGVLVLLTFMWNTRNSTYFKKLIYLIVIIIVIIIVFIQSDFYKVVFSRFIETTNLDLGGRLTIWKGFYERLFDSILNFLLGPKLDQIPLATYFDFNLHNSFLNLYSRYGFIIFVIVLILMVNSLLLMLKRKEILLLIISFIFIMRASTDLLFSYYYGDVLMYFLVLYSLNKTNKYTSNSNLIKGQSYGV